MTLKQYLKYLIKLSHISDQKNALTFCKSCLVLSRRLRQLAKPKHVAWLVSHCTTSSKREEYVAEMRKYIDVDIYG